MVRKPIKQSTTILLGIFCTAIVFGGYTWLSIRQHNINPDDKSIPMWKDMYTGFIKAVTPHPRSQEIWLKQDAIASGSRLGMSLAFSVSIAFVLGMLGCFSRVKAFISPVLSFCSQVPPTAIIAVFFAFVPIINNLIPWTEEYNLYIAIVSFGLVPSITERMHLAIRDVPDQLIFKAYTLGASHLEVVFGVVFRQILPHIIDAIRGQIGPSLVYLIAAEMLCSDEGFGYRIRLQSRLVNMDVVFPYIIALALFGFLVNYLLKRLQSKLCPWFEVR